MAAMPIAYIKHLFRHLHISIEEVDVWLLIARKQLLFTTPVKQLSPILEGTALGEWMGMSCRQCM